MRSYPLRVVGDTVQVDLAAPDPTAERAEWGATHALAVSADVLRWLDRYPGARAAIPLAQALDAVEGERLAEAEGLLRGALTGGWRGPIEGWLYALCADHFLSFGHRLIYQVKVLDLLRACDWEHAEPILLGHLAGIVYGTREDVLPAWKAFSRRLDALDLDALAARRGVDPGWHDLDSVIDPVLGGKPIEAFEAVVAALQAGAPWERVADALSLAAAERMIRFDVVRHALARWPDPRGLRLLLHAARFAHHHRVLDGRDRAPAPATGTVDELVAALVAQDSTRAMALAAAVDVAQARPVPMDLAIADSTGRPIVQAHVIKGTVVAFEETEATGDRRPLQALAKLLSSPIQQRWVQRRAREAVAFVTAGKVPRLLAP